ncbi:hypothetical protein L9F63_014470 [Diploptera punctata]|uniref:Uncharacterized protein n=1 Tax=Diploptera punctata TaxID=6984 RepID=A0AAD8ELC3_DIPPU|nr:hypothetical protein L9F63_014470 [Diploptera punctata]
MLPKRAKNGSSNWIWKNTENCPFIHLFRENTGVCEQLFNKYPTNSPSELLLFLDFMDPLFAVIAKETNDYAQKKIV